jgi:hypothetical protein
MRIKNRGYEWLPILFIVMRIVNPDMHYKYIPKPDV